ncbi:MAG TPA: FtsX-like permease family protein [Actinomycetota bacterium]
MLKATLKGLAAHKLRMSLTALAIVLGVGFVAGTFVLTDTINKTFDNLFNQVTQGVDVAVRTNATFNAQGGQTRAPMPSSVLDQVKGVQGVAAAEGSVNGYAQFIGSNGKPVTTGGAPTLGVSLSSVPQLQSATTLRGGARPTSSDQVAIDAATAKKQGFKVGDRVKILFQGPPREFTVSGILGFGTADNLAGATLAGFDLKTAQQVLNRVGTYDEVDAVAASGVSPATLRDRVKAVVDPKFQVLTGKQLAQDDSKTVGSFTKFINIALLAFAFVALFVGSFIIVNTFSIILAQRTRELALLRCLGASRRQVLRSVLAEAAIVGLAGSVVGIGFGILVAIGLNNAFKALGVDLPQTTPVIAPRTIIVALVVGLGVTLLASIMPAIKATRVPPVAALQQEAHAAPTHHTWRRVVTGTVVTVIGVALLLTGLFASTGNRLINIASGAVIIFLGVGFLSPLVARPLARLLGWPFAHWAGEPGKLARENAMRSPRRTASTAAALMIGLALVSFVTIFAASLKTSSNKILDESVAADYILSGPSNSGVGFSPQVVQRISQQPEIESATGIRFGAFKLNGKTSQLQAIDPATFPRTVRTDMVSGNLSNLASGDVAVRKDVAKSNSWKVGDTVTMDFPVGGSQQERIAAIYEDNHLNGSYLLTLADYQNHYPDQLDQLGLVKAKPNVSTDASRAAVERVTNDFPIVQVKDQAQFKRDQAKSINQILLLFYLLLALAVIVAFIGIINTLALSVLERIRELGLLRAVGMTRAQLRRMIRWEAVIVAVLGAVLGLVVGGFFGWTMVRALHNQGITEFTLPVGSLLAFVIAAGLAGMAAAIFPGRRAAKVDVLRAITTE